MANKILHLIERYRHGPLGISLAGGAVFFGGVWTILEVAGVTGGVNTLRWLILSSAAISGVVYILILQHRLARLMDMETHHPLPEVRESLETAITRVEPGVADKIRAALRRYEETIEDLQDQLRTPTLPLKPVLVEGGTFIIGADNLKSDETPPHEVEIPSFLMDPCPVTNQQFAEFLSVPENQEWTPDNIYERYGIPYFLCEFIDNNFPPDKWDHPVVWINWYAAAAFCNWRSLREGKQPIYEFKSDRDVLSDCSKSGWRLPTEVEWERAAREGLSATLNLQEINPTIANYGRHYRGTTAVGRFKANPLGIWDLLGNVKEWCHDWYEPERYHTTSNNNYLGPEKATGLKVFRGASWMEPITALHITRRGKLPPANTNPDLGFRCVRRA